MNIALITAGGTGSRMQLDIPKQFIEIQNKPLIVYTLEVFEKHKDIDAIIIAVLPEWKITFVDICRQYNLKKVRWIVNGGKNGQESIYNGLVALHSSKDISGDDVVVIHDGNRPMVTAEIISNNLKTQKNFGSAITAIPCVEAVFESEDKISATYSLDRNRIIRTQTPHAYPLSKLLWAHEEAKLRGIHNSVATCTLMVELGEKIYFSPGSELNLKITTQDDLEIFKALVDRNAK